MISVSHSIPSNYFVVKIFWFLWTDYTKTTDGYTEYDGSYSLKGANVSGKYSAHHLEQCRGANSSGSSDVAYVKGKAGISPVSGAGGRGKVGLVKVREDIGPVRVRAEALSADVGG